MSPQIATAFAPASVANLAVGFDVLGFAVSGFGDRVRARVSATPGIRIAAVTGCVPQLPRDPDRNTASVAVHAMGQELPLPRGLALDVHKGIPLGSGMGGSAASAVAAVVAANALLERPVPMEQLLAYAVAGESVASGSAHADNVAPSLLGGLVAVVAPDPLEVVPVPVPAGLICVLVHPHLEIETRAAREALGTDLLLSTHVHQSQRLAGFLAGCYTNNPALVGRSMLDLVGEPTRASLIPGYEDAKEAALKAGALGFAISGAGPSVFALVNGAEVEAGRAEEVESVVVDAFSARGLGSESWIGPIAARGAYVLRPDATFLPDEA